MEELNESTWTKRYNLLARLMVQLAMQLLLTPENLGLSPVIGIFYRRFIYFYTVSIERTKQRNQKKKRLGNLHFLKH